MRGVFSVCIATIRYAFFTLPIPAWPNVETQSLHLEISRLHKRHFVGLVAGLGISIFSKPLALLLGLLIVGVQTAESYGIHLVPYQWIQGYAKSVDLRSAVQDNAAFKISFGMMFALSAFAEF